ncbi:MAG: hypothetical protein ACLFVO_14775 [Chloroflexaceae bacterium]
MARVLSGEEVVGVVDNTDELGDENCTILAFRTTQTPTYTIKAQGLPRFEWYAVSGLLQTIGEDTSTKDCGMVSVRNIGGASHGLQIIVTGDALERNLFQPQIVYVVDTDHMLEHTTIDHKDAYILTLPALTIPAGLADPFSSWQAEPGQLDKAMNADSATRITVLIGGQGKAIGSGTLSITLIPLANPEQGQYTCTCPVVIKEPGDDGSSTVLMIPGPQ